MTNDSNGTAVIVITYQPQTEQDLDDMGYALIDFVDSLPPHINAATAESFMVNAEHNHD